MKEKIKVLVLPSDTTGVGKFRSVDPHTFLQDMYSDDFHVDIDYEPKLMTQTIGNNIKLFTYIEILDTITMRHQS